MVAQILGKFVGATLACRIDNGDVFFKVNQDPKVISLFFILN